MKKKVPLLAMLVLSLSLYGCATCATKLDRTRENLQKLKLGMSEKEVLDLMNSPYSTKLFILKNRKSMKVLKYVTEYSFGGPILNSDLTPICLEEDRVIGWGRKFYNNKKHTSEFLYQ